MNGLKILIFGVGGKYKHEKERHAILFKNLNIVGYLDNNETLWESYIDEVPVMSPDKVQSLQYDKIILMADYVKGMKEQLLSLGVETDRILLWSQFLCMDKHGTFIEHSNGIELKSTKERVLLISVELKYNGGTIAIINAAKALQKQGYHVTLAAPSGDEKLIEELSKDDVRLVIIPSVNFPQKEELEWIRKFDIVIVNVFQMIRCACIISQFKPVIWWIHENSEKFTNIYPITRDNHSEFDNLEAMKRINIVAVSSSAEKNFNHYYPFQIKETMVYGVFDTYCKIKTKINKNCVFAVIGTVEPRKGQMLFLEAIDMLNSDLRKNAEFWIIGVCGKNSYADLVREKAEKTYGVKMVGELTQDELKEKYQEIDIVVCSSLEETMSLTITEGMMNEKVCITTDATGISEFMEDKINGLICKSDNAESLRDKMEWVLKNPHMHKKIRENARKTYEKYFTMEKFGCRIEKVIKETLSRFNQQDIMA